MKAATVSAVEGWQEAVSEEGRFRILFPGQFETDAEGVKSMKGFKFSWPDTKWFAHYSDFDVPRMSDDEHLRSAYRSSVESMTKNEGQVLSQRDVLLNGRMGTEFVIQATGTVSYMRGFLFERRMYTLAVDRKREANGDATIPSDVKQFFESFTYWDVL